MARIWILVGTGDHPQRLTRSGPAERIELERAALASALRTGRPKFLTFRPDGGGQISFRAEQLLGVGTDEEPDPDPDPEMEATPLG